MKCPKCKSEDISYEEYMGATCIVCHSCKYREADVLEVFPESKISQKEKGRYTPYKTGGSKRNINK